MSAKWDTKALKGSAVDADETLIIDSAAPTTSKRITIGNIREGVVSNVQAYDDTGTSYKIGDLARLIDSENFIANVAIAAPAGAFDPDQWRPARFNMQTGPITTGMEIPTFTITSIQGQVGDTTMVDVVVSSAGTFVANEKVNISDTLTYDEGWPPSFGVIQSTPAPTSTTFTYLRSSGSSTTLENSGTVQNISRINIKATKGFIVKNDIADIGFPKVTPIDEPAKSFIIPTLTNNIFGMFVDDTGTPFLIETENITLNSNIENIRVGSLNAIPGLNAVIVTREITSPLYRREVDLIIDNQTAGAKIYPGGILSAGANGLTINISAGNFFNPGFPYQATPEQPHNQAMDAREPIVAGEMITLTSRGEGIFNNDITLQFSDIDVNFFNPNNQRLQIPTSSTAIIGFDITDGGSGYTQGESVTLTGTTSGAANATGELIVVDGVVTSVTIANGGSEYAVDDILFITNGNDDCTINVDTVDGSGTITGVTIIEGGTGYSVGGPFNTTGGSGSGATMNVITIDNGVLVGIFITPDTTGSGSGYIDGENLTIGGTGSGAVLTAQISRGAQFQIIRIYADPFVATVYYGRELYLSVEEARSRLDNDEFSEKSSSKLGAFRGYIIARSQIRDGNYTWFTNSTEEVDFAFLSRGDEWSTDRGNPQNKTLGLTQEQLDAQVAAQSTGVIDGGGILTQNGSTAIDISSGSGVIVNIAATPPTASVVAWDADTNVTVSTITGADVNAGSNYILKDVNGLTFAVPVDSQTLKQSEIRQNILLGVVKSQKSGAGGFGTETDIFMVQNQKLVIDSPRAVIDDYHPLYQRKSGGVVIKNTPATTYQIANTSGTIVGRAPSTPFLIENPNIEEIDDNVLTSYFRVSQRGFESTTTFTAPDDDNFDNGTLIVSAGTNFTLQRLWYEPTTKTFYLQYGTATYNQTQVGNEEYLDENPIPPPGLPSTAVVFASLLMKGGTGGWDSEVENQLFNFDVTSGAGDAGGGGGTTGITALNTDTATAQTLTGGTGIDITDATPDHSFAIDATVVTNTGAGTDNAIARFDAAGNVIQNSTATIDDLGNMFLTNSTSQQIFELFRDVAGGGTPIIGNIDFVTKIVDDTKIVFSEFFVKAENTSNASYAGSMKIILPVLGAQQDFMSFNSLTNNKPVIEHFVPTRGTQVIAVADNVSEISLVNTVDFSNVQLLNVNAASQSASIAVQGFGTATMFMVNKSNTDDEKSFVFSNFQNSTKFSALTDTSTMGILISLAICNGGSGYVNSESVTVTGQISAANDWVGTVTVANGVVTLAPINNGGTGYTLNDVLTIDNGTGATVTVTAETGGIIDSVEITTKGTGYTTTVGETTTGGTGTGATVDTTVTNGIITAFNQTSGGSGYTDLELVTVTGSSTNAVVYINAPAGAITGFNFSRGSGYIDGEDATITTAGSTEDAVGTVNTTAGEIDTVIQDNAGDGFTVGEIATVEGLSSSSTNVDAVVAFVSNATRFLNLIHGSGNIEVTGLMQHLGVNTEIQKGGGIVQSASVVLGGTGYENAGENVQLTGVTSLANDAFGTATVSGGAVQTITITEGGEGYVNGETVTVLGLTSTANDATATVVTTTGEGYIDFEEISTPDNPATNFGRLYVRDDSGTTSIFFRDSAGAETDLISGTGDVTKSGTTSNNTIVRWDGADTNTVQGSTAVIDDGGSMFLSNVSPLTLEIFRNIAAGTSAQNIGQFNWVTKIQDDTKKTFSQTFVKAEDRTTGVFSGSMRHAVAVDGTLTTFLSFNDSKNGIIQHNAPSNGVSAFAIADNVSDIFTINNREFPTAKVMNINSGSAGAKIAAQGFGFANITLVDFNAPTDQQTFIIGDAGGRTVMSALTSSTTMGILSSLQVSNGGNGYTNGETVTITGVISAANDATVVVNTTDGRVETVSVNAGGTGYAVDQTLTITGAGGNCTLNVDAVSSGAVTAVTITAKGSGYAVSVGNATTVVPAGGTGCTIDIDTVLSGVITSFGTLVAGTGYTDKENVILTGTNNNAVGFARETSGPITSLHFSPGTNYIDDEGATVTDEGGGTGAAATLTDVVGGEIEIITINGEQRGTGYTVGDVATVQGTSSSQTDADVKILAVVSANRFLEFRHDTLNIIVTADLDLLNGSNITIAQAGGEVISSGVTNGGSGYDNAGESVRIVGQTSGANDAFGTAVVSGGAIQSISSIDVAAAGYINGETVDYLGQTSFASSAFGTVVATTGNGFIQFEDMVPPADPPVDNGLLYIRDIGVSSLFFKNDSGANLNTFRITNNLNTITFAATVDLNFDPEGTNTSNINVLTLTGDVTFTTSNLIQGQGVTKTTKLIAGAANRIFTFPSGWSFVGAAAPATISANKVALLSVTSFGSTDSDVVAAYSEEL